MRSLVVFSCLVALIHGAEVVSYSGERVFRLHTRTVEQAEWLHTLRAEAVMGLDFWTEPSHEFNTDVHVPLEFEAAFLHLLDTVGLTYEIMIEDLGKAIEDADLANKVAVNNPDNFVVGTFARHADINRWVESLKSRYPNLVSSKSIGSSFERRDMKVLKISTGGDGNKPIIWLDGGIHAREWLAVATVVWVADAMLNRYGNDPAITQLLEDYDFQFLPVVNPDGYEYSHTSARLWRKTRKPYGSCFGCDPNRNWGYMWSVAGSSSNPCSDIYHGPRAFSEIENINLRDYLTTNKDNLRWYLGFHSYSQFLMPPYAYGFARPPNAAEVDRVGDIGVAAIRQATGKTYVRGTVPELLYSAAGGTFDWVTGVLGKTYSYTYELRPDRGSFMGFIVPPSEIAPTGREVLASIVAMVREENSSMP